MEKSVIAPSMDDFYYLSRLTLVKDEAHFDKFDRAFAQYFKGVNAAFEANKRDPARLAAQAHGARADAPSRRRSSKNSATTS